MFLYHSSACHVTATVTKIICICLYQAISWHIFVLKHIDVVVCCLINVYFNLWKSEAMLQVFLKLLKMLLSKVQKISLRNFDRLLDDTSLLVEKLPWILSWQTSFMCFEVLSRSTYLVMDNCLYFNCFTCVLIQASIQNVRVDPEWGGHICPGGPQVLCDLPVLREAF